MSKAPDENDKLQAGVLSPDLEAGTRPVASVVQMPGKTPPKVLTVKELLESAADRALGRKPREFCTTGVQRLDDATGGLRPGHVWVFGADTNWGKSSYLVMLADVNMKNGKRVLIVSSEDDHSMYGDRLMVRRARVGAKRFRDRELTPEEMTRVTKVLSEARPDPVFLDARGKSAELVAKEVKWAIAQHNIDLVAYDYLQEFRAVKRYQDRRNEVSEVAAMLREAVKTSGKTGIIFSQITVSADKRYPDKHSIRESRDVSNAAEVIALGFTPAESLMRPDGSVAVEAGKKAILIDKAKDGIKGAVQLMWSEEMAAFGSDTVNEYADEFDDFAQDGKEAMNNPPPARPWDEDDRFP